MRVMWLEDVYVFTEELEVGMNVLKSESLRSSSLLESVEL